MSLDWLELGVPVGGNWAVGVRSGVRSAWGRDLGAGAHLCCWI
jgi:hypothetical protein